MENAAFIDYISLFTVFLESVISINNHIIMLVTRGIQRVHHL